MQVVLCFEIQYLGKHAILGLNDKYHKDALSFDFEATGQKKRSKVNRNLCIFMKVKPDCTSALKTPLRKKSMQRRIN